MPPARFLLLVTAVLAAAALSLALAFTLGPIAGVTLPVMLLLALALRAALGR